MEGLTRDVVLYLLEFVGESALVQLSAVDKGFHDEITRDLFSQDGCVICGATFCILDNRYEACLNVYKRSSRRHKGTRSATRRERRTGLIENRKLITSPHWYPRVDNDAKDSCHFCRKTYLPWRVSDDEWRATVPAAHQVRSLCFSCYSSRFSAPQPPIYVILLAVIIALVLLAIVIANRRCRTPHSSSL